MLYFLLEMFHCNILNSVLTCICVHASRGVSKIGDLDSMPRDGECGSLMALLHFDEARACTIHAWWSTDWFIRLLVDPFKGHVWLCITSAFLWYALCAVPANNLAIACGGPHAFF